MAPFSAAPRLASRGSKARRRAASQRAHSRNRQCDKYVEPPQPCALLSPRAAASAAHVGAANTFGYAPRAGGGARRAQALLMGSCAGRSRAQGRLAARFGADIALPNLLVAQQDRPHDDVRIGCDAVEPSKNLELFSCRSLSAETPTLRPAFGPIFGLGRSARYPIGKTPRTAAVGPPMGGSEARNREVSAYPVR